MKINLRPQILIAVFLLLNVLLISAVIFIFLETGKNKTLQLESKLESLAIPNLAGDIKKINVGSRAFIIYDPQTRTVVFGKNEKLRFSPASTAKIMTALIVLEEYDLGKTLVAKEIDQVQGSKMKLEEGEVITVENLLYGLMLPSGNDAAFVLASNYVPSGGQGESGETGFVKKMNQKAKELKLVNTKFFDPTGYMDENYTTAYDLARLASYSLKNAKFRQIVSTKTYRATDVSGKIVHELSNLNELLGIEGV